MRLTPRRVLVLLLASLLAGVLGWQGDDTTTSAAGSGGTSTAERSFAERRSGVRVAGSGVVERVLADDNTGSRHQRFILRVGDGQTLLVAHNIDLAPRIANLRAGDSVRFAGEYEWNSRGGVLHWTHHDPQGRRTGGWLEHAARRYE